MAIMNRVQSILSTITVRPLGVELKFNCIAGDDDTVCYIVPSMTGVDNFDAGHVYTFSGSEYVFREWMQYDDIVRRLYTVYQAFMQHELMEGFQISGVAPFTPHHSIASLLAIQEVWNNDKAIWESPTLCLNKDMGDNAPCSQWPRPKETLAGTAGAPTFTHDTNWSYPYDSDIEPPRPR